MVNTEVKGTLAKLLATENLKVEHRKVSTACFDVHNRVLILPIWKTASATVYDLLVGHEVGHALYTPDKDFGDAPKDFVNVLEDARIERLMKVTYPGLRKSFFEGYTQLWEDDFFGVKEKEIGNLPFIDRINLYFKGKPDMPFSEEESVYVVRASQTKSFDEVIALAKELMEYAKQKQQEKVDLPAPNTTQDGGEMTPNGGGQTQETQSGDSEDGQDNDPADLNTPSYSSQGIGGDSVDETRSLTEETLREALETLVDDNAKEWVYIDVPEVNLAEHIITWKEVRANFDRMYQSKFWETDNHYLNLSFQKCEEYKKSAQKSVNYLVKQFEMKKSARQYARAATSKTGVIDTNSLYKYKLTDDIFKKVTTTPDGKNHGLVMLLDWSGSMTDCLMDTLRQTYNLIWFCKKVNIPFRVYAFQSGYFHGNDPAEDYSNLQPNALHLSKDFFLLEFFSSEMNTKVLDRQMQLVWAQAYACARYTSYQAQPTMVLGGTPLAESVICMREIVAKMKSVEKVQKVNVVCLTDGESNPMSYITDTPRAFEQYRRPEYLCHNRHKTFILRDPVTRYSRKIDASPYNTTREIVSFYREITDYNWIGIRLCSKLEMNRIAIHNDLDADLLGKQWQKERYAEVTEKLGFSKQFFMPNSYIGGGTDDIEVKTKNEVATKAELTRAFKKHMGSKMTNKTILNAFIEQIA
jgi:hypothetical protein